MKRDLVEIIERDSERMDLTLPEGAPETLAAFTVHLRNRAVPAGLIAEGDRDHVYERHVRDCLRAAALIGPGDRVLYDLGSGAGLPGVVVALAAPQCQAVLVESRRRRVAFLELMVERLPVTNAEVAPIRVEELSGRADVITARAFRSVAETWRLAAPLLGPDGRLIYFAGASFDLAAAVAAGEGGPPADVSEEQVLARSAPLVIMTRQ